MVSARHRRGVLTLVATLLAALCAGLLVGVTPAQAVAPRTPSGLPTAIEPLAYYVGQVSCDPHTRPGTRKLAELLVSTYHTGSYNTTYSCGTDGSQSEHYDGRAIDWMVDIHNARQYSAARAVLTWLLATDKQGNRFAMARRLGVMYVIYDNRMWGAWDGTWQQYNGCYALRSRAQDNACHRTHMHISLGWNGAMGRTSFWTKHVYNTDFGPCRADGLNWGPRYVHARYAPCPNAARLVASRGASATRKALVAYSGAQVGFGWRGPAVSAVQSALHVAVTGTFGAQTKAAVQALQRRHHLPAYGWMYTRTWRALLASVR